MRDTNVGPGMVPHQKNCCCDECTLERLQIENQQLQAQADLAAERERELVEALEEIAGLETYGFKFREAARNALAKHKEQSDE